jgi:DNA-binding transcriptional ArsR family regulator
MAGQPPLDAVFGALADPTRRAMIERLTKSAATVSELAKPFDISLPAIMRHVHVLEEARLVESRKEGRQRHCRIAAEPLLEAIDWIVYYGGFWEERLDSLEALLSRLPKGSEP